jgi:hypothetical protein
MNAVAQVAATDRLSDATLIALMAAVALIVAIVAIVVYDYFNGGTPAASCMLLITVPNNARININANITFDFQQSVGLTVISPSHTFALQSPYSYKLMGCIPGGANNTQISWYNVTTGTYIGAPAVCFVGWINSPAVAYITCAAPTMIALRCFAGGCTASSVVVGSVGVYGWATIDQIGQ